MPAPKQLKAVQLIFPDADASRAEAYLLLAGLGGMIPYDKWLLAPRIPNPGEVPWYYSQWLLWMELS
jgi:hypothetical protein